MYTPINPLIYIAATAGASAGMAVSGRTPTDPLSTAPINIDNVDVIGAWAQAFDTLFAAAAIPVDELSVRMTETLCTAAWQERNPVQVPITLASVTPSTYTPLVLALLALIEAEEAGIGPGPAIPGGLVTYSAQNADDVTISNVTETTIAEVTGVVVKTGQKVIVWASVCYELGGDVTSYTGAQQSMQANGVDFDTVASHWGTLNSVGRNNAEKVITRCFEYQPTPGTYRYTLTGLNVGTPVEGGALGTLVVGGPDASPFFLAFGQLTVAVVTS
jgi:hypothetical protein